MKNARGSVLPIPNVQVLFRETFHLDTGSSDASLLFAAVVD